MFIKIYARFKIGTRCKGKPHFYCVLQRVYRTQDKVRQIFFRFFSVANKDRGTMSYKIMPCTYHPHPIKIIITLVTVFQTWFRSG